MATKDTKGKKSFPKIIPKKDKAKAKPLPKLTKEQKAKLLQHKAPEDFKPAFYELRFRVAKDGIIDAGRVKCERIKGNWDNEDAKRYDLSEYDPATLMGLVARLSSATAASNPLKRLPANTTLGVILRSGMKKADGTLSVTVKNAYEIVKKDKASKPKKVWFEDKSANPYKQLRRAAKLLRGAFTSNQLPPSGRVKKENLAD